MPSVPMDTRQLQPAVAGLPAIRHPPDDTDTAAKPISPPPVPLSPVCRDYTPYDPASIHRKRLWIVLNALFCKDDRFPCYLNTIVPDTHGGYTPKMFKFCGTVLELNQYMIQLTALQVVLIGMFVKVNPVTADGSAIAQYRNLLVTFHKEPTQARPEALIRSRLPVAILLDSGSGMMQAVIRVGARDKAEYLDRAETACTALEQCGLHLVKRHIDPTAELQLPAMTRLTPPQTPVAGAFGCTSWEAWQLYLHRHNLADAMLGPLPRKACTSVSS